MPIFWSSIVRGLMRGYWFEAESEAGAIDDTDVKVRRSEHEQFFDLSFTTSLDDPLEVQQDPDDSDYGETSSCTARKTRYTLPMRYNDYAVGITNHATTKR